jgi:alkyl hydroperoxide reductase subunit AhpC
MLLKTTIDATPVSVCFSDYAIGEDIMFPSDFFHSTGTMDTSDSTDDELLLIYFYPGDFTTICVTELLAFHNRHGDFEHLNTRLVACSVNGPEVHAAWKRTPKANGGLGTAINHPIISDMNRVLSKQFDVLIPSRNQSTRGWFLLDRAGKILLESRTDTKTARDVSQILATVADVRRVLDMDRKRRDRAPSIDCN